MYENLLMFLDVSWRFRELCHIRYGIVTFYVRLLFPLRFIMRTFKTEWVRFPKMTFFIDNSCPDFSDIEGMSE